MTQVRVFCDDLEWCGPGKQKLSLTAVPPLLLSFEGRHTSVLYFIPPSVLGQAIKIFPDLLGMIAYHQTPFQRLLPQTEEGEMLSRGQESDQTGLSGSFHPAG